jgi:hypothetical protein
MNTDTAPAEVIHLTLTGPNAGLPACILVRDGVPEWGTGGYTHPAGHRGVHYSYAPAAMVDGSDSRVCRDCLDAWNGAH